MRVEQREAIPIPDLREEGTCVCVVRSVRRGGKKEEGDGSVSGIRGSSVLNR